MKDILEYLDYQEFLRDLVAERKAAQSWFSVRWLANKIAMDHGNFIKVLQGKRHLPAKSLQCLGEWLDLPILKKEYLAALVEFNKSRTPLQTKKHFDKLMSILDREPMSLQPSQYEFYKRWYHTAILHTLDAMDFRGDFTGLAARLTPAITPKQAEESVQLLTRLGMLALEGSGRYAPTNEALTTGNSWRSLEIQAFQEATLQLAIHSLQRQPRTVRDFSTMTMSICQKDLPRIKDLIKDFRKALLKVVSESEPVDSVYHMNIQLFPMSHTPKTSKGKAT